MLILLSAVLVVIPLAQAGCPYSSSAKAAVTASYPNRLPFDATAFAAVDFDAVKADLRDALTTPQAFWPPDFGNYGPFWVRMAWHCAGTYRTSDGRGGCDGARQRFEPERSWDDNVQLDKARALLQGIKLKHGAGLSWGDLIVLAGTTAIESMGGPVLGFCAGRIDDVDGADSLALGPTPEQQVLAPCPVNGNCSAPLGANTVGLIYLNPEGPMGVPDPVATAPTIRDTFGRMGMNDSETVALIGAHAFGKAHGACPTGPGPSPKEQPFDSWPGTCGSGDLKGKGNNTFTAGFEGPWSSTPTEWGNEYFNNLLNFDWEVHVGPGGHNQWRPLVKGTTQQANVPIMMLTSDVSLTKDPSYLALVQLFASNQAALDTAFSHAWYKLVTRDMGPVTRCLGKDVPPAQPFQFPLPDPPANLADFDKVRAEIRKAMTTRSAALTPDTVNGKPSYASAFALLAQRCASSFHRTNFRGGCNGARIRFSPEKDWPQNRGLDKVLDVLAPVKAKFGSPLSWADLIVLAGTVANADAGAPTKAFCGGRADALDGAGSEDLDLWSSALANVPIIDALHDYADVVGLTPRQFVALTGGLRSPVQQMAQGYSGSWTTDTSRVTSRYFKVLLTQTWVSQTSPMGAPEYKAVGKDIYMTPADLAIKFDSVFSAIAQEFAVDYRAFLAEFASGWTQLMNADRFLGPAGTVCL